MGIKIELLGFKGRVTGISSRLAHPPWCPEDQLMIHVEFDKPYPASIISTAISIPVREYSEAELLEVTKVEGEKQLAESIRLHDEQHKRLQEEKQREKELKALAESLEAKFEGMEVK